MRVMVLVPALRIHEGVGAVQVAGVGVAPAPGRAAAGGALDQAAGQAQAEPGDLVGDLALAEFGAGWR